MWGGHVGFVGGAKTAVSWSCGDCVKGLSGEPIFRGHVVIV